VQIHNEFQVTAPPEQLWAFLLDVERIAPCMPGAELTEVVDDRTWKGKMNVKFGPVSLSFAGTVSIEERDDAARRVVLKAKGMEQKGKGAANATVTSWLEPEGETTTVKMDADITLTGFVAQVSRGMLPDISQRMTNEFATCLEASMGAVPAVGAAAEEAAAVAAAAKPGAATPSPAPARPPAAKPVGGIRLGLWALFRAIARFFRRLFGGRTE
jgi:hypothetical protein